MHSDNLKSYLSIDLTSTSVFADILNGQGIEFDNLYINIDDILAQTNVDTATWGLDIFEKGLGIITDYTKNLDYRRSVIKSRERVSGKLNTIMIKLVCDSFSNGNVSVTYDGIIHVKFTNIIGTPPNMSDLKNAVEQIKPAYLLLDYLYSFLLIKDIDNIMTINKLQATLLNKFAGGV